MQKTKYTVFVQYRLHCDVDDFPIGPGMSEYHYSRKYIIRGFNLREKEISRFLSLKLNKVTRKFTGNCARIICEFKAGIMQYLKCTLCHRNMHRPVSLEMTSIDWNQSWLDLDSLGLNGH